MPNMQSASFCPEATNLLKEILGDITTSVLQEGSPIIVLDEYRWMPEVLSLLAKQVNLCESCILLLENGMEQEAYLLARSQFNNMLWIKYICEDEGDERAKEFFYQSYASQILHNKNLIKMLDEFEGDLDERFNKEEMTGKLNEAIEECKRLLDENGVSSKVKSISDLAKQDGLMFGTYITAYNDASKFEHSDMSKMRKYRKQVVEEYSENVVFTIEMGSSDKSLWMTVLNNSAMSLYFAYDSFAKRIETREDQLFTTAFVKEAFNRIYLNFKLCMALIGKENT